MAYSGNLVAMQGMDAKKLPAPDPAHGQATADPYAAKWTAPPSPDYGATEFPQVVMNNGGLVLDTPSMSHDGPAALESFETNEQWQREALGAHSGDGDRGWVRSQYHAPELQFSTESYHSEFVQGFGSPNPNPVVLQRGKNSLPVNNPEREGYDPGGFRRGFDRIRFTWRQRLINQERRYDLQPVWDRSILQIDNSPVPQNAMPWSPFAESMARGFTRMNMVPELARGPVDISEAVMSQNSDPGLDASSVITGGTW